VFWKQVEIHSEASSHKNNNIYELTNIQTTKSWKGSYFQQIKTKLST